MIRLLSSPALPVVQRSYLKVAAVVLGVISIDALLFADAHRAFAETTAESCKEDSAACGEIKLYNDGWFTYSDIYLEGSRKALLTDISTCNSIDYTQRKDLLKGQVRTFKVPAPCHYTLIVNVAAAIGKASTKTKEFLLTPGCEIKLTGSGTVDDSHLKLKSNDGDNGCGEQ